MKHQSGITRIGYGPDTNVDNVTWVEGKPASDGTLDPNNTRTEHSAGSLFGGTSLSGDLGLLSMEDWETLKAMMEGNEEKHWFFEYQDGRAVVTRFPINIFVQKLSQPNARDGLVSMILSFEHYSDTVLFFVVQTEGTFEYEFESEITE